MVNLDGCRLENVGFEGVRGNAAPLLTTTNQDLLINRSVAPQLWAASNNFAAGFVHVRLASWSNETPIPSLFPGPR